MLAQIAVVSDRLARVFCHSGDESEAAALHSPIQIDISAPRLEACHQSVSTVFAGVRNEGLGG